MQRVAAARGFSLVEALVASLLVVVAVSVLAHLLAAGARRTFDDRRTAAAATLAHARLEELRSAPWRFAADGSRISDASLALAPPETLTTDRPGYFDALDRDGSPVTGDETPHFVRRWSIGLVDAVDPDTLLLKVCVFPGREARLADACVWGIRTRKP